jgi:hypothetical protein
MIDKICGGECYFFEGVGRGEIYYTIRNKKMKTLFIGSSKLDNKKLFTIVNGLTHQFSGYVGVGGSSIVAAVKAVSMSEDNINLLFTGLRLFSSGYKWDEYSLLNLLNSELPTCNIRSYKTLLVTFFGNKKMSEVNLGVVAYNITKRKIELIRNCEMLVVDALLLATSMPSFMFPMSYESDQYIDVTPINRFPLDIMPLEEDVYSIYIRSSSETYVQELLTAASKPWQDIVPDMLVDH